MRRTTRSSAIIRYGLIPLRDTEDAAKTTRLQNSNRTGALEGEMKHRRSTELLEAGDLKAKKSIALSVRDVDVEVSPQDPFEDDESGEEETILR
ncbi:hypothetical protein F2Q70_00024824 [Brassica cretica]|uniref:Uncharacterized protein n=1 Tax=Brassica cretica TaxID=69181 RepID=A0A8S9L659_BRACR|nr:hypothetical protein F2Q70_00024824 [Brassica cretica]